MSSVDPRRPGTRRDLIGRGRELELIDFFLDAAAVDGGSLLLVGEPGVGKTALLHAAAETAAAAGTRVLQAVGVEFEFDIGFSGLNQALLLLFGELDRLSVVHRDALAVALGFSDGAASDRLVVSTAALALLRRAAEDQPLLLIVDDVHWIDRLSAAVLGFVARRLSGSHVGLLATSRSTLESFFASAGLPAYEVRPLNDDAASELVDSRFPRLGPKIRQRVLAEAQGNPLALLELPIALNDVRLGSARLPSTVQPSRQRQQPLFASRVRELPTATRRLLLLAALERTGDVGVLLAAGSGGGLDDLLPAENADLAYLNESSRRVIFRHPLVRLAVVQLSTSGERRQAHRALAEALADELENRAWHLAEASVESDEQVAGLLEQAGHRAQQRGDAEGAVAALLRAADLSPRGADRSRRLAAAAYVGADLVGDLSEVPRLLADARKADPEPGGSLQAAVATAYLLISGEGDIDTAHRLLTSAIESRGVRYDASDSALIEALYTLLTVCFFSGRPEMWQPFDAALARFTPRAPVVLSLAARLFADPARATSAALSELEALISRLHDEADPAAIVRVGRAAFFVDRMAGCREAHWRVVRDGREGGAVASAIHAIINLSLADYLAGEWDQALLLANEGLQLCEAHGYHLLAWPLWFSKAIIAAGRGDDDSTRALADDMDRWAAPRRAGVVQDYARLARALAASGRGDFEYAYHELARISAPGILASHVPQALWAAFDLVDAAVRTGRHSEALAHSNAMRDARLADISPRLALVSIASAAITAPDDRAAELFEQALAIPGADRWSFDLARVQFAYGERLRRGRAIAEARVQLSTALMTFERLNAQPWATRASQELRAAGSTRLLRHDLIMGTLTPQEREIALLAATGLTNRQIGERLYLSHRTVGAHLHNVFPKLGITSRAALRDALSTPPPEQSHDSSSSY